MARTGRVISKRSRFYGAPGVVRTSVEISPDVTNSIENIKFMRARLLSNIASKLDRRIPYLQNLVQQNAPWDDHPGNHGTDEWPNDIARNNLKVSLVYHTDTIGLAVSHPNTTVYYGSDKYPGGFYYGAVLELGRGATTESGKGQIDGSHYLQEFMVGTLSDEVIRYMSGNAVEGITFKKPRARTVRVRR